MLRTPKNPAKTLCREPQPQVRYIHYVPQQQAAKKPPSAFKLALVFFLVFTFAPAALYLLFLVVMALAMGTPK